MESKGKGKTLRPVAVRKFLFYGLVVSCQDPEGPTASGGSSPSYSPRLPLKQGAFAYSLTDDSGLTYEIQGRVPRKGHATGTIHVSGSYPVPHIGLVVCDSTVNWTAKFDNSQASG